MNDFCPTTDCRQVQVPCERKIGPARRPATRWGFLLAATLTLLFFSAAVPAEQEQTEPAPPVVVQPGAPGMPSKTLPPSTRGVLPPRSSADVELMQGMVVHHAQAVEMTAMIASHTENKELQSLGA